MLPGLAAWRSEEMRAPTSANTLKILIDDFRRFLPTLSEDRTIADFDAEPWVACS